jgi:hypothetical protein
MKAILQSIAGLYQLIGRKRAGADWTRQNDLSTTGVRSADRMEEDLEKLQSHLCSDIQAVNALEILIHQFTTSPIQSAPRTLALRAMENASMILRREIGDPVLPPANLAEVPVDTVKAKRDRDREDLED